MARPKVRIEQNARVIGSLGPMPETVVKSAGRTIRILELFDELQRDATVVEIAEALGYPQSSCAALLRSLKLIGYLHYIPDRRSYIPTTRVSVLGNWVNRDVFGEGRLSLILRALGEATGETIMLAAQNGLLSQYIHVQQAPGPDAIHLMMGTTRPLIRSGTGYAILTRFKESEITRIVLRSNAERPEAEPPVSVADVLAAVEDVRRSGYAYVGRSVITRGGAVLAMPLPLLPHSPPLAIAICGHSRSMNARKEELVALLDEHISRLPEV
ncbi:IclR family transcriptional regulator [Pararhodobacter marinus]|uniref:IclR family transcriptional regulator n=1 Tax=Pararhodobacter marinus TaxID=2184063 RepID=A0A2U2CHY6_9RHOB|nr:helix-turn-helix domain-containing protein [Pararhodobacter marinus]PWE31451.1 IclR family transcriptional regulator [Pararhodobacter marinus]